jgi:mRNA interferase RelE/StbE
MKYSVVYDAGAEKALRKMDKAISSMIYAWVEKHLVGTTNPRRYGRALSADLKGLWRYRVGDYRLIADIEDRAVRIVIIHAGHRSKVYN